MCAFNVLGVTNKPNSIFVAELLENCCLRPQLQITLIKTQTACGYETCSLIMSTTSRTNN